MRTATLLTAIALVVPIVGASVLGQVPDPEDLGVFAAAGDVLVAPTAHIDEIVAPTSGAPAFLLDGDELRIELAELPPGDPDELAVFLVPSDGTGPAMELMGDVGPPGPSKLWEGPYARQVHPVTATVPLIGDGGAEGLFDVVVGNFDDEPRAVRIYDAWPERPRLVLLADTQTGDPRALSDGGAESFGVDILAVPPEADPRVPPDPRPFNEAMDETYGIDVLALDISPDERWAPYREAIAQINALAPDVVLFSGDLTFGQAVPGSYHIEYAEAWALINGRAGVDGTVYEGFSVPTLLSPGNHDGYVADGEDGLAFWEATFGPPAFRTTFANVTFVSINTYDWSELDRVGLSAGVSAWGGQVRDEQLAWVRKALCQANGGTPGPSLTAIVGVGCSGAADQRVVTFAHHSPSWQQDTFRQAHGGAYEMCPCEMTPVVEQVGRAVLSYEGDGQAWAGENRLELRDTLREFDVDLHAAGHTHRDRIARDIGDGTIVEVPQRERDGLDITELQMVERDDTVHAMDQTLAVALLTDVHLGPLYVETATTSSDTDEYFGYRPVEWHPGPTALPPGALGIAPFEMGYPMTQAELDAIARDPSRWNVGHASFGLYSVPTYPAGS